jgi:hypothetical protein
MAVTGARVNVNLMVCLLGVRWHEQRLPGSGRAARTCWPAGAKQPEGVGVGRRCRQAPIQDRRPGVEGLTFRRGTASAVTFSVYFVPVFFFFSSVVTRDLVRSYDFDRDLSGRSSAVTS